MGRGHTRKGMCIRSPGCYQTRVLSQYVLCFTSTSPDVNVERTGRKFDKMSSRAVLRLVVSALEQGLEIITSVLATGDSWTNSKGPRREVRCRARHHPTTWRDGRAQRVAAETSCPGAEAAEAADCRDPHVGTGRVAESEHVPPQAAACGVLVGKI